MSPAARLSFGFFHRRPHTAFARYTSEWPSIGGGAGCASVCALRASRSDHFAILIDSVAMALSSADRPLPSRLAPKPSSRSPQALHESWTSESSPNILGSESPSHYSSFSSSDSDEQVPSHVSDVDEDAASDVVGVSMSRAQSRMKSRTTPAEEKNKALEDQGGYFANVPDTVSEDGLFLTPVTTEQDSVVLERNAQQVSIEPPIHEEPQPSSVTVDHRMPRGPHREAPAPSVAFNEPKETKANQRSSFTRSLLKTRPRAWSGEFKKLLPDLASLKKRSSISFTPNRARSQTVGSSSKRSSWLHPKSSSVSLDQKVSPSAQETDGVGHDEDEGDDARPISELRSPQASMAVKHSYTRRPSTVMPGRPPSLRRSSSDHSLYLRASSTASSLEQRPRYENVHSQLNSRFKAIKDSLSDSGNRLINMPNMHFQDIGDRAVRPHIPELGKAEAAAAADRAANGIPTHGAVLPPPPPKSKPQTTHPILEDAMSQLTGDVVVIGGYRGSVLRDAQPPHRRLWVPIKVGLNLRKVNLEVGLSREAEERIEETVIPSSILSHIGPVDICRRILKRLRKCDNAIRGDLRVWDFGYDWRLSPELLSRQLVAYLEKLPCNQVSSDGVQRPRGATVIAHSLGGLLARHAVNQRPELFAGVLYAGAPQHCVNILGPLRNGDDVLFSSRVLTAQVNFSFRTSFAFLPDDGQCFINKETEEEYKIDFYDSKTWDEYRLSPCIAPALPPSDAGRGFKDFGLVGKRFSLGPREDAKDHDVSVSSDQNGHQQATSTERDISARNPARKAHGHDHRPIELAASAAGRANDKLVPAVDGFMGPISHPRGSSGSKVSTTSTIPRAVAIEYLQRTLDDIKKWRKELEFIPEHQAENRYPPAAVLFGKSVPTVYGARVASREAIKQQDAFDDLAFAAGDGVCLASAAMLPPGYRIIKGGLVKTDRGHVGLLGDLEGVGQCLRAMIRGRKEGVGLGR